jgi:hypothetical protein
MSRTLARFDVTDELITSLLSLPDGAVIERMHTSNDTHCAITIIVSHPDFPEVQWGEWIPRIDVTVKQPLEFVEWGIE